MQRSGYIAVLINPVETYEIEKIYFSTVFGSSKVSTKLKIHANVVFGSIRFEPISEPSPGANAAPSSSNKDDDDSEE